MTSTQLLAAWSVCEPMFKYSHASWFKFLRIAASGERGTPKTELRTETMTTQVHNWEIAGLVEEFRVPSTNGGRMRVWLRLGPKGKLLMKKIESI